MPFFAKFWKVIKDKYEATTEHLTNQKLTNFLKQKIDKPNNSILKYT